MAYDRESFKDVIEANIGAALLDFCRVTLARKNGKCEGAEDIIWQAMDRLGTGILAALLIGSRGFSDRRAAFDEVVSAMKNSVDKYVRVTELTAMRDYGLPTLVATIDDADRAAFWAMVDAAAGKAFQFG